MLITECQKIETDNKVQDLTIVSRLSRMQKDILAFLAAAPQPVNGTIRTLPRTGDIIDAIGKERSPAAYAAVSRALHRLEERGLVSSYASVFCVRGKGLRYSIRVGEQNTGRGVAVFKLGRTPHKRRRTLRTIN